MVLVIDPYLSMLLLLHSSASSDKSCITFQLLSCTMYLTSDWTLRQQKPCPFQCSSSTLASKQPTMSLLLPTEVLQGELSRHRSPRTHIETFQRGKTQGKHTPSSTLDEKKSMPWSANRGLLTKVGVITPFSPFRPRRRA